MVNNMYNEFNIDDNILKKSRECENLISERFKEIDEICEYNTLKVLSAFHKNCVSECHFNSTTGNGYNDLGRSVIESVYSDIFIC